MHYRHKSFCIPPEIRKLPKSDPEQRGWQAAVPSHHHRKGIKNRREGGLCAAERGDQEVALASLAANPMKKSPTSAFPIADSLRLPFRRLSRKAPQ